MKKQTLTLFLFTIYVIVQIFNLSSVFLVTNPNIALLTNYGSFSILIGALITSSPFSNDNSPIRFLFKKALLFPFFVLSFYLVSFAVSIYYMNYDPLFGVLPNLIRCTISIFVFSYLFSYILYKGLFTIVIKNFTIILTAASSSILILKSLNIELSYLIFTDLQSADTDIIGRASGLFLNANTAAQFTLYAIILLLYFLKERKISIWARILLSVCVITSIYSLLLTFSTTGFINLFFVFAYFIFTKYVNKLKFLFHFVAIIIIFQILILSLVSIKDNLYSTYDLPLIQQEKIDNILNVVSSSNSAKVNYSYRDQLFEKGVELIQKRPFFGYGAGEFMTGVLNGLGIHNTYLQITGEAGIFISLLYLVVCFSILKRCYRIKDKPINFLVTSGVVSSLLYQLSTHGILYSESVLLMLIFFNCISILVQYSERKKIPSQ